MYESAKTGLIAWNVMHSNIFFHSYVWNHLTFLIVCYELQQHKKKIFYMPNILEDM